MAWVLGNIIDIFVPADEEQHVATMMMMMISTSVYELATLSQVARLFLKPCNQHCTLLAGGAVQDRAAFIIGLAQPYVSGK